MYKKGDFVKVFINGKPISGAVYGSLGMEHYSVVLATGNRRVFRAADLLPNAAF
jgi:hypothetical protein